MGVCVSFWPIAVFNLCRWLMAIQKNGHWRIRLSQRLKSIFISFPKLHTRPCLQNRTLRERFRCMNVNNCSAALLFFSSEGKRRFSSHPLSLSLSLSLSVSYTIEVSHSRPNDVRLRQSRMFIRTRWLKHNITICAYNISQRTPHANTKARPSFIFLRPFIWYYHKLHDQLAYMPPCL